MKFKMEYMNFLKIQDKSYNTILCYISDVSSFETDVGYCVESITPYKLRQYIKTLEQRLNPRSVNRKISSIKSYVNFINKHHKFDIDLSNIKMVKICYQDFLESSLTLNETKRIIKHAEMNNDIRAVLIIKLLLLTGGRVSEVLQLKLSDLNSDTVSVKGKGSKYRKLLISKKLQKQINLYLSSRLPTDDTYLLTGIRGKLTRHTVHTIIKKYAGKARVKLSKAHSHSFRHLYTKLLFEKQVPYSAIQQLLGHNLTVTDIYGQLDKKELLKIVNSILI